MSNLCSDHITENCVDEVEGSHDRPGCLSLHSHGMSELVQAVVYSSPREDWLLNPPDMQDMLLYTLIEGLHSLYNPDEDAGHVTRCAEVIDQFFFGGTLTPWHHLDITVLTSDFPFPASTTALVPQPGQTPATASVARISLNPQTFIAHGASMRRLTFAELIEQLIVHMAHAYILLFSHQRGGTCRRQRWPNAVREDTVEHNTAVRSILVHIFEEIQDWNTMLEDLGQAYIDGVDE